MPQVKSVIGIDLGGTKLAAALFEEDGGALRFVQALDKIHYKVCFDKEEDRGLTPEGKSRLIEDAMVDAVKRLAEHSPAPLAAVGVASAGFVENGFIVEARNIGMRNYPLRKRIADGTGVETYIYKDSWTPIYAIAPEKPCLIFSIGTGFGGVSCGPDWKVSIRCYSARKKPVWVPMLYFNDDPAYAASFSQEAIKDFIAMALAECRIKGILSEDGGGIFNSLNDLPDKIREYAKADGKLTPSKVELLVARALAPRAAGRVRADEIFADALCCAMFPVKLYGWLTGREPGPAELDEMAVAGDPVAVACMRILGEFIGRVLALMQKERIESKLPPAVDIFGTGSGFNIVNANIIGPAIVDAMRRHAAALRIEGPQPSDVRLIQYTAGNTTLACYGAAVGAARGIVQD